MFSRDIKFWSYTQLHSEGHTLVDKQQRLLAFFQASQAQVICGSCDYQVLASSLWRQLSDYSLLSIKRTVLMIIYRIFIKDIVICGYIPLFSVYFLGQTLRVLRCTLKFEIWKVKRREPHQNLSEQKREQKIFGPTAPFETTWENQKTKNIRRLIFSLKSKKSRYPMFLAFLCGLKDSKL